MRCLEMRGFGCFQAGQTHLQVPVRREGVEAPGCESIQGGGGTSRRAKRTCRSLCAGGVRWYASKVACRWGTKRGNTSCCRYLPGGNQVSRLTQPCS